MSELTNEHIRIIKHEMAGLSGKEAKRVAAMLASQFDCDISRIYHHSKDVRPKRQQRKDTGALRAFEKNTFDALAWYTVNADFSGEHLSDIAAGNGLDGVKASTFNRHLRRLKIDRKRNQKDIQPYLSFEAKYPNLLHQMDSTVAQQFYLDDDGSIGYEPKAARNKNKPGNKKPRLTLLALVDDNSRCKYARFMLGNHTFAWMSFLYEAWRRKDDIGGFPFFGMPKMLYSDNDSVVKSKKFRDAMEKLMVKIITHEVGKPRSKGKVEVAFKLLQEFEKITIVRGWKSLEEANQAMFDYLYRLNGKKHSVTGEIPFERWLSIPAARLLDVPSEEIFRILHLEPLRRVLSKKLVVSIDGKEWQLPIRKPFVNFIGESIEIYRAPNESDKVIVVLENKEYEVHHMKPGVLGVGGNREELLKPDSLERREALQALPDPGLKLSGFYKDLYRKEYSQQPVAQPFDATRITGDSPSELVRTKLWFTALCQEDLGFDSPPAAHERDWIESIFAGSNELPEKQLLGLVEKVRNGEAIIQKPSLQIIARAS